MQEIYNYYAFTLGREWKLSLAELLSIYWSDSYRWHTESVALLEIHDQSSEELTRKFRQIGGSIRMIQVLDETDERRFPTDVIDKIRSGKSMKSEETTESGKITFALGAYGTEYRTSDIGLRIKKTLVEDGMSVRLVNTQNENINAASFKKERLAKTHREFNLIRIGNTCYIGSTLACQDVDAYSQRDTAKSRDMVVGMMPPKLVQIMLNLAIDENTTTVYDPFCGLWTTLIEAANRWVPKLIGSDLSKEMARSTKLSLEAFIQDEKVWQERIKLAWWKPNKDFSNLEYDVFDLDATKIYRHFEGKKLDNTVIVSEWYLGAIMQRDSITLDRVKSERLNLMRMYDAFFRGLKNLGFAWNTVMTFPFWDIHGTESYFTEIYEVFEDAGYKVIPLLEWELKNLLTKTWSLLYKRPGQNVGREVIRVQLK